MVPVFWAFLLFFFQCAFIGVVPGFCFSFYWIFWLIFSAIGFFGYLLIASLFYTVFELDKQEIYSVCDEQILVSDGCIEFHLYLNLAVQSSLSASVTKHMQISFRLLVVDDARFRMAAICTSS